MNSRMFTLAAAALVLSGFALRARPAAAHSAQPVYYRTYRAPVYYLPPQPAAPCGCVPRQRGLFTSPAVAPCGRTAVYPQYQYTPYPAYAPAPSYPQRSYYRSYEHYPHHTYRRSVSVHPQRTRVHATVHRTSPRPAQPRRPWVYGPWHDH
jgi:hypothetical protein